MAKNNNSAGPSAFLSYEEGVSPYKRSRVDSTTIGQERLFTPLDRSATSKNSAKNEAPPTTSKDSN